MNQRMTSSIVQRFLKQGFGFEAQLEHGDAMVTLYYVCVGGWTWIYPTAREMKMAWFKKAEGDDIVVKNIYRINSGGIQRGLAR